MTTDKQTDRQTNRQTGQKQYAPDHSIRGHKKQWQHPEECMCRLRTIAMCDYHESVTTGQTDNRQSDPNVPALQAAQKSGYFTSFYNIKALWTPVNAKCTNLLRTRYMYNQRTRITLSNRLKSLIVTAKEQCWLLSYLVLYIIFQFNSNLVSEWDWLLNVTSNNITVIYVTAHRCAGRLKKFDLWSGSRGKRHFVGFFNVPTQALTRGQPFYTVILRNRFI